MIALVFSVVCALVALAAMLVARRARNSVRLPRPACGHDDTEGLYIHPRCHPAAGTWVEMHRTGPAATVSCRDCSAYVCTITARPAGEPFGAELVLG